MVIEGNPKIGVFLCECGREISDVIELSMLEQDVAEMPGVVLSQRQAYCCSKVGLHEIRQAIERHGLDRVVVAGCTPRTHGPLFEKALEEAGLSPSCLEVVNVREQCAWVHADDPEGATEKALDLTRMAVAKAALVGPRPSIQVDVTPAALVIGGGTAGLTAAATVAASGFPVILVEKEPELGGQVARLHTLYPRGESASEFIKKRIRSVEGHEDIQVLTGSTVTDISGPVGDYRVTVTRDGKSLGFHVGTVIVATGAREADPSDEFQQDGVRVVTQSELELALREGGVNAGHVVTMVYEPNPEAYSSVAVATALKNSLLLKRRHPEAAVSLIFNDLSSDLSAAMIEEARALGVRFYSYDGQRPPRLANKAVEVFDRLRGEAATIPAEVLVLAMPLVPHDDAMSISSMLSVPVDKHGFFLEPNVRLRPRSFLPTGIFVCGSAHYPVSANESVFQGYRAAARALRHLSAGTLASQGPRAQVRESLCVGCGSCVESCPFDAISMVPGGGTLSVSSIDASLCKGCGNCTVVCPAKAIVMEKSSDMELIAQIDAALAARSNGQSRVLALLCEWSGCAAADLAGAERRQYPANVRIIRVGCAARFDPYLVLWAFLQGADGVLLGGCDPGMCHYVEGNRWAVERIETLHHMLKGAGFDARRLSLRWLKPDDGAQFVEVLRDFLDEIEYLGPTIPVDTRQSLGASPQGQLLPSGQSV
ncbi:MAG TPA: hydrogenase iron-sulfur subunit [Anaerolineae bacterium]|nr:hydrogenase iron-sulfur subunit [Anaerolineae bacterium]